jgi:glycosyltransferase involved in cell wall biosynthesis
VTRVHRSDLFFERWDKLHNPFVERAYGDWLDAFRPDLVHVHHWARLTTTLVSTAADHGIPAVLSLHDFFASCPRYHRIKPDESFCTQAPGPDVCRNCVPRWTFQGDAEIDASVAVFVAELRREAERAAVLVAPTTGHGRRVMDWLGLQRDVVAVPPPGGGVATPARPPLADRAAMPGDPLRVGLFGHLHPTKGPGVLLDAQASLPDPSRIELHLWGEPPTPEIEADLKARAEGRPVVWHGAYEPSHLAGAAVDVVAIPTLASESYSLVLDEAASLGVPIVASDRGALADRATGRMLLVPAGDVSGWATALQRLAAEPQTRAEMAAAPAPVTIDEATHVARLTELYAQVLAGERPPGVPRDGATLAQREHAFVLREVGLVELLRSEGWEGVIAARDEEIARLRTRLSGEPAT